MSKVMSEVRALVVGLVVMVFGAAAYAAPIVDGKFDTSEGYTTVQTVNYYSDAGHNNSLGMTGKLWTYSDPVTRDLYAAFIQPLTINDNTYGTTNASDWGGSNSHKFNDLVGSDKAEFYVKNSAGTTVLHFYSDYITKGTTKYGDGIDVYTCLGVTGGDGSVVSGDGSKVTANSSLSYNFNTLNYHLITNSPQIVNGLPTPDYTLTGTGTAYAGWVFPIIYEVKIAGSVFGSTPGTIEVISVHNSPPKDGSNASYLDVTASLGDYVWHDKNADGIQDANEPGIGGVTVALLDGSGNPTGRTTTTNASGYYLFDNLTAGNYGVQFTKPAGYDKFSPKDVGANDAIDSDADRTTGKTAITNIIDNEVDLTWDSGFFKYAALGDYVWLDKDVDGIQDTDETGIDGVTVKLLDGNMNVIGTKTTANGGHYLFDQLTPGSYYVQFIAPSGLVFTLQNLGDDAFDSDADPLTGLTARITLESGQTDLTWDAGLHQPGEQVPEPAALVLLGLCGLGLSRRRVRK